jgi:DNA-binding CsgD family transcriptional regulator
MRPEQAGYSSQRGQAVPHLSHSDFDLLQRTILELHDLRFVEPFRAAVPDLFVNIIPSDWFVVMDVAIDMRAGRVSMSDCWESSAIMSDDMVGRMARVACDHPFSRYTFETGNTTALKLSDFFSVDQLKRTELYNEFYGQAGAGRILATSSFLPRGFTTLNAARPLRSRDFTERDRLIMNLLSPHFRQARCAAELNTRHATSPSLPLDAYALTPREREVAVWLAQGKTSGEIGRILQSPTRTVEKHVERVLFRLGAENRTAAARIVSGAMES